MKTVRRVLAVLFLLAGCVMPAMAQSGAGANQSQTPKKDQQTEFIPLDQLPPQEQLPAARLLIAAYVFVVGALFVYILSVSRRVGAVRREVQRLESDLKRSGRA